MTYLLENTDIDCWLADGTLPGISDK